MTHSPVPNFPDGATDVGDALSTPPDSWMTELGTLLNELDGTAAPQADRLPHVEPDDVLPHRRLGIAGSLFAALQCKHAETARHSSRVALICSAWAARQGLDTRVREQIEIAALLHDVGVIGMPDQILLKPGRLDQDEAAVVQRSRSMSLEILRRSCTCPEILAIVANVGTWYDGSRMEAAIRGEQIPLPARMIAVAEAYDAMTTDRVYRPAMSQERATAELFRCAGGQFDPQLVRQFVELQKADRTDLQREVADRWLVRLDPQTADAYWDFRGAMPPAAPPDAGTNVFQAKLLDNMYDAVIFVDAAGRISQWNHGAERLTGISGTSIFQRQWHPEIINMTDEKGRPVTDADCPVLIAIQSGVQSFRRLTLWGRNGRCVAVDSHAVPVIGDDGTTHGAILLLHDASSEISLEQRCQSLSEKATRDPLTQVANRAEFDRVHAMFVAAHQQQQVPCSLLMCDLDKFKSVNDTYGHQAGDDAIKSLATLLKGACRPGDLVARYGGEEFVMLCADCDNASATRRAEQIRKSLAQMPQPKLGGRAVTVSFGVTEIQPGDTPETMLRRSDRALLTAKENGRNQVVQLGSGSTAPVKEESGGLLRAFRPSQPTLVVEQTLITPVPVKMAIEKLRGFVADHTSTIVKIDGNHIQLELTEKCVSRFRRLTDRPVTFLLDLRFEEQRVHAKQGEVDSHGGVLRTRIFVGVSLQRDRDRRRGDVGERAQRVLISLRSYLMAVSEDQDGAVRQGAFVKVKQVLIPWLRKK